MYVVVLYLLLFYSILEYTESMVYITCYVDTVLESVRDLEAQRYYKCLRASKSRGHRTKRFI